VLSSSVRLPTGEVTFLFSDIEGSTWRWEQYHDPMKAAVARHEQLMSAAIERHGGYIFKMVGDAFCAAFPTAEGAVCAALDAQLALANEDFSSVDGLRVRMGLHTGYAEERNADYFGPAVNRVARLMSIGHGGQVLLSASTRELAHRVLPTGASLVDLGLHRLKDLTEPEQVWQLAASGLLAEFPSLKSLSTIPNNLPFAPTSFRGREQELEEVKSLLSQHKLVTLFGSGGVGKTRLAVQVAAEVLHHYPDGVWFADLAPIADPKLVSSVVAKVLGVNQVQGRSVDEAIQQWLKDKKAILILDNCEHLLETVAHLADAIVRHCPEVRMLATSRQSLGINGEVVHRLPSLAIPKAVAGLQVADALQYGAIALFVDRAKAADTRFSLSDSNAPIVAEICRHLDGIPLAIELAAARVKILSIPNLAQRLNERFKILTGGSRAALPRQKTLSALIEWSYELLTPEEQMLFARTAIFAGGFGLDAAAAVCAGEGLDEVDILDLVSSLADKSLVVADTTGEQEHYHLLESTRAYALEKLITSAELQRLARCHGEYYRDKAQDADKAFNTTSTFAWFANVERDLDNYRAALDWGLSQAHDPVLGAVIAGSLEQMWYRGGLSVEGRYWIEPALARISVAENPQTAAKLWLALAYLSSGRPKFEAAERAVSLYESAGDDHGAARARVHLAFVLYQMGLLQEASETSGRALATLRKCGDKAGVAGCLYVQGLIAFAKGAKAEARDFYAQALALYKVLGHEINTANLLSNLADLEFSDGHPERAMRLLEEALVIDSRGADTLGVAIDHINSAAYRMALGDVDGARTSAREGLRLSRSCQNAQCIAIALQYLALHAARVGQPQAAAKLLGFVTWKFQELRLEREPTEKWGYETLVSALGEHLSEAEIEKLGAEGAVWSEDQAVEEALKT
jgi:predicted ATPase/class 3 adenylate cyclase